MQTLKRNIDLVLILAIAFLLRFSVSITHSYTNDELSAINRLRYDSFSELIEKGVKQGDMHPAGVQVFEKIWSSLFGTSELALRLPFVLFGTASVFLIFLIGQRWFNRQTGIIAAGILAVLYFPIIQSELARPYSPGLFIVLLVAWFYHRVLFDADKKYRSAIFLGLSFAAGMYTHYFLFLSLLFIGFTGLFFLRRDNFKAYLLAAVLAAVLYLPHISVTLYHLSVGGLGWLGKPDNDFIFQFIFYAFNESWIVLGLLIVFICFWLIKKRNEIDWRLKYWWISLTWFMGIYVVGHVISLYSTPVLKFPVMLFAFPFFVLVLAYLLSYAKQGFAVPYTILLSLISTFAEQDLFGNHHMGYRETAKHLVEWNNQYGDENIYTVYNLSNPDYMNFYAAQYGDSIHFDWDVIEFADDAAIRRDLMNRTEKFCVVGYSERLTLPQVFETVKEFYPKIEEHYRYDNSGVFLMSKEDADINQPEVLFSAMDLYDVPNYSWYIDSSMIAKADTLLPARYILQNEKIYGPDFVFPKSAIDKSTSNDVNSVYLMAKVKAQCPFDGQLTVTITATRNDKPLEHNGEIFWMGHDLEEMLYTTADSNHIGSSYFAFKIPEFIEDNDQLKISLWNRNGVPIAVTSFEIWLVTNLWN